MQAQGQVRVVLRCLKSQCSGVGEGSNGRVVKLETGGWKPDNKNSALNSTLHTLHSTLYTLVTLATSFR